MSPAALLIFLGGTFVPVGGHHGTEVFVRRDTAAVDLLAVGDIDAPPSEVEAVLLDYAAAPRIVERLADSRVLQRGAGELVVYQRLKLPVIKNRDFTLLVRWDDRSIRFAVSNERGPQPTRGCVRLTKLEGSWTLEPLRGGLATHARYHVVIDFAGSVPTWMVRSGAAKDLPSLFEGVRRLTRERKASVSVAPRNSAGSPPRADRMLVDETRAEARGMDEGGADR